MCRQNQLWGLLQIAFGIGLLIGLWIEAGFLSHCFGFGMIILGCVVVKRR